MSKKKYRKWIAGISFLVVVLSIVSCMMKKGLDRLDNDVHSDELSAWIVDWQRENGIEDGKYIAENAKSLQLFAAYFNHDGKLLITESFKDMYREIKLHKGHLNSTDIYVTIVNDRIQLDGTSLQKDPELIKQQVKNEKSRQQHIHSIMEIVELYDLSGVEIDYEKVADEDWLKVIALYSELYERLKEKGKKLRIVLEPNTPLDRLPFPNGPIYVMMAYNLYGTHSGPGPKANPAFIERVAEKLSYLPGEHFIALSTGGFDWSQDGTVTSLTEEKAIALSRLCNEPMKRDEDSGSLSFSYVDEAGLNHTVWYSDSITFSKWIDAAKQADINNIALWRLGEISQETIQFFSELQ